MREMSSRITDEVPAIKPLNMGELSEAISEYFLCSPLSSSFTLLEKIYRKIKSITISLPKK